MRVTICPLGLHSLGLGFAAILGFGMLTEAALAEVPVLAWVETKTPGRGFLFSRLDACYLVTPGHVVQGQANADLRGSGQGKPFGRGELVAVDAAADIALLRVSGPLAERCGLDYVSGVEASKLVSTAAGLLSYADAKGNIWRDQVDIIDVDAEFLRIRAAKIGPELSAGQSGSLLVIDGNPAGMLLTVHTGEGWKKGVATVRRYDDLWPRVSQMLESAARAAAAKPRPGAYGVEGDLDNLASSERGARMVAWSAQPTNPLWHADNLLGRSCVGHWEAILEARPIDLDLELAGQRVQPIRRVEVRRCADLDIGSPEILELFVSVDRSSWSSVGAVAFNSPTGTALWDFGPRRARYLRVRINGHRDTSSRIGLSKIIVQ